LIVAVQDDLELDAHMDFGTRKPLEGARRGFVGCGAKDKQQQRGRC
jgi:hypothetical protein